MKISTITTIIAVALYLVGFSAIACAFGVYFTDKLTLNPEGVMLLSGFMFIAGAIILHGASVTMDAAFTRLNTVEHPQWIAQQRANEKYAAMQKLVSVEVNGRSYTLTVGAQIEAYSIAAEYVQDAGEQYELSEADYIYETHLRIQMGLPKLCYCIVCGAGDADYADNYCEPCRTELLREPILTHFVHEDGKQRMDRMMASSYNCFAGAMTKTPDGDVEVFVMLPDDQADLGEFKPYEGYVQGVRVYIENGWIISIVPELDVV